MATGITKLHSKGCSAKSGGRCRCNAGYEASVYSRRDNKKIRKTFPREAEAKSWRADALGAVARGGLRVAKPTTVEQAWETWYAGAKVGTVTNRSGDPYKPSALRTYETGMRLRVLPAFGQMQLVEVYRADLQEFADGLLSEGLDPSTIQVTLLPLRAIARRALSRGELAVNPCTGLELPAVRGRRERYATPGEAERLIAALPIGDRPIWAAAMYAGIRRGELRALRVEDVDLANGVIRVERGWDEREGEIALKSHAGRRKVPISAILRDFLSEHLAQHPGRDGSERIFGVFDPGKLTKRADRAWKAASDRDREAAEREGRKPAPLDRITLHECRHTFASLMIAAGVNAKALQSFMGHANIGITLDRYGHLMPGTEAEAAGMLDTYLAAQRERQEEAARAAGGVLTGEQTGERGAENG